MLSVLVVCSPGFEHLAVVNAPFETADIKMELSLHLYLAWVPGPGLFFTNS